MSIKWTAITMNKTGIRFGTILLVLLLMIAATASGQYFGRNKVQYEDFEFQTLETEHFKIYFYPAEKRAILDAAAMLEQWIARFENIFGYTFASSQPVILYANHADFQQTNVISGLIPQSVGGVTEGLQNRMVIPLTGVGRENDHVLGHELVHAYHYDIMKKQGQSMRSSRRMPLWLIEGMSEYLTIGHHDPLTSMWLRDAVLHDDVPTIEEVAGNQKYFPYRYGHAIWAFITGTYGDQVIQSLFNAMLEQNWSKSVAAVLDIPSDSLSAQWQRAVRETYSPQLEGRTKPSEVGRAIAREEADMNLSPSLSPDGEKVAYLSNRDLFSIDLYLADTQTGEVITRLDKSETDAHFDALRFMNSAGAWSPDGNQLAFVVFRKGDNWIALYDVTKQSIDRLVSTKPVNAVTYLSWSPDGRQLVFSGSQDGIKDLYTIDLQTEKIAQLTDDAYAEIQPAWSPDGKTIAFATDRGQDTDLDALEYGDMKIGILNVKDRDVELLSIEGPAKHINPNFSPDGEELYVVADPDGVSDVYRYNFDESKWYRVTRVATGISGLTELSPALSVARQSGEMVVTVFEKTNTHLYQIDTEALKGEPFEYLSGEYAMNTRMPSAKTTTLVDRYLQRGAENRVRLGDTQMSSYDPDLSLVYVGQSAGVAINRYGSGIGGGVNMLFSDMLGNHMLSVDARINGGLKDLGGQAYYMNRDNRIHWGGGVGHIPYETARVYSGYDTLNVEGENIPVRRLDLVRQRIFNDHLQVSAEYPYSQNRRLEWGAGYTLIYYNREVNRTYQTLSGAVVRTETEDLENPSPLHLVQSSIAYVGDYSTMGFTAPVQGKRYRFEVEPTAGSLRFMTVLADYRHYINLSQVTLAGRVMHYGRYLRDAEDDRLSPLWLGYETWIRGYSLGSYDPGQECTRMNNLNTCPELDRLMGSRVGVVNLEVRVPVFGIERYGLINFPYLPTDFVGFVDGGVAWTKNESPDWTFKETSDKRIPVFSAGLAARVNLFGYLVGQIYYAYPFQRPERGAHWGFTIAPGW
jgi:hypothetical protein